jgi:hypothetical protein
VEGRAALGALDDLALPAVDRPDGAEVMNAGAQSLGHEGAGHVQGPFRIGSGDDYLAWVAHGAGCPVVLGVQLGDDGFGSV